MPQMRRTALTLALALALPTGVPALDRPADLGQGDEDALHTAYLAEVASTLAGSADAFERMVAAALLGDPGVAARARQALASDDGAARRDALVADALQDAGDDPLVWWSAVLDCPAATPAVCERDLALARLRAIEPDNALVWLVDLPALAQQAESVDAALGRAAAATRFDVHAVERVLRLVAAFARVEPDAAWLAAMAHDPAATATPAAASAFAAVGIALGDALPPISPVMQQCRQDAIARVPARGDTCRAIARTLVDASDSMLGAMLGTGLALELARTADERSAALAARRDLLWLAAASGELESELATDGERVADHLARWNAPGATELSALRSLLIENGLPLQAPDAWTPPGRWAPDGGPVPTRTR